MLPMEVILPPVGDEEVPRGGELFSDQCNVPNNKLIGFESSSISLIKTFQNI
jgi:hypothetical protein